MNGTEKSGQILFYVLNGFGITPSYLIVNFVTFCLGVMILFLNFLVMDTLRKKTDITNTADVFLVSLALADFLTGILVLYNTAYCMINFQNSMECRFRYGLLLTVAISSGFHLLAMTVDRYIKIMKPLRYNRICKRSTFLTLCISVWGFAVLVGLVPTFGWKNTFEETNRDELLCSFFGTLHVDYLRMIVILFFIPVILMLILYGHIFKVAYRHSRQIAAQESIVNSHTRDKLSWKFTKTISIIVGTYLAMWLPTGILVILVVEGRLDHVTNSDKGVILLYTAGLAFINSLMDPIIYAFQIPSVKKRFKNVFCCKKWNSVPGQVNTIRHTEMLTERTRSHWKTHE